MEDHSQTASRPTILIVEDHLETRTFLKMVLQDDYQVETASNATMALEKAAAKTYDILLIDIALRDRLDGVELVEELRQMPAFQHTPMIAMTAHQFREHRDFYIDHGFDEYMAKPFFPDDLLETITRLLKESQDPSWAPGASR